MTTANDWTKEMATKGFPELKQHYAFLGAPNHVMLHRGEHFPHNYNAVSRSAFFTWLNQHFKLGRQTPVIERDFTPLTRGQLTVWDAQHPAPAAQGPDFERQLLQWFSRDADEQLRAAAKSPEEFRRTAGAAVEVLIGRTWATAGDSEWQLKAKADRGDYLEMAGLVANRTHREQLPVVWLYPKKSNGRAVLWLDDDGKAALYAADGTVKPAVRRLLDAGTLVLGADLLFQGEFLADGRPVTRTRAVKNPREFAGYTFGYNSALFAQRTQDVLTLVKFLRQGPGGAQPNPSIVAVAGFGGTGPIAAAARVLAGGAIDRAAVATGGFRFGQLLDFRDPRFLPGGAKYLDVPGLLALGAPHPLWVAGEGTPPTLVTEAYKTGPQLSTYTGLVGGEAAAAATWLLQ